MQHGGYDVLILGAGFAGLVAAVEAREAGARVLVIEKGGPSFEQTSTAQSGGVIACYTEPYYRFTPEDLYNRHIKTSQGTCDKKLIKVLCERMSPDYEWFSKLGVRHVDTEHALKHLHGSGKPIMKDLHRVAEERGVKILFEHKAKELLTGNRCEVNGVRVLTPDGVKDFKADAVILATGGFEWNGEMILKYFGPQIYHSAYRHGATGLSHTGDGALMAMEVGASFMKSICCLHARMEDKTWIPGRSTTLGPKRVLRKISNWGMWVNKWGKRFVSETKDIHTLSCAAAMQPEGEVALIFDEAIKEKFSKECEIYDKAARKYGVTDIIMKFDTLKDLSDEIGIPYSNLKATITEFNAAIKDGRVLDLEIPRCEYDSDLALEDEAPEPTACRIEKPPFYAVYPAWPANNTIWGGLDITDKSEVKDRDGDPIPGLYACGGLHGGIMYGKWYQLPSGTWTYYGNYHYLADSLPTCLVFARVAGNNAASAA